jgi:putative hydrolase of HD superfamily
MNTELADAVIALGKLSLLFGRRYRVTYHEDGLTGESVTDHTVMLGLTACAVAARLRPDLNLGKVAINALVHDVVEVYALDTSTVRILSADAKAAKKARERASFERIADELGLALPWLIESIEEYERQDTPEAVWVWGFDKALPKITHIANGGVTLHSEGVTRAEIAGRYDHQERELAARGVDPALIDLRHDLVDRLLDVYDDTVPALIRPSASEYTICPFDIDSDNIDLRDVAHHWLLRLTRVSADRWAVARGWGSTRLSTTGEWDYASNSDDLDEWRATHWFTFEDAVQRANEALRKITRRAMTFADAVEFCRKAA